MPTQKSSDDRLALLPGTPGLLILNALALGSTHGQRIAGLIQHQSEEVFFIDHGSLYLALQRPEDRKWVTAKRGVSENNRKARCDTLTANGRDHPFEDGRVATPVEGGGAHSPWRGIPWIKR